MHGAVICHLLSRGGCLSGAEWLQGTAGQWSVLFRTGWHVRCATHATSRPDRLAIATALVFPPKLCAFHSECGVHGRRDGGSKPSRATGGRWPAMGSALGFAPGCVPHSQKTEVDNLKGPSWKRGIGSQPHNQHKTTTIPRCSRYQHKVRKLLPPWFPGQPR